MCDHKYKLNGEDRKMLKSFHITLFQCIECERQVRMLPKKIRIEEDRREDVAHDDDEATNE